MLINSNLQYPPLPPGIPQTFGYMYFPCPRSREFDAKVLCVYHSVSCTIILSVVYYPISCALLGHLCNLSVSCMLQVAVGSYASLGQLCIFLLVLCHSVGCMITLSVMYYSVSCVLPHQLCINRSVVHFSVSCTLLDQLCITQSVVSDSVSCVTLSQLDDNSVSCLLLCQLCTIPSLHLCITPSGEFNPLFPISIFETLSNFTQLQVTQLIEVVKQKFFQTWEYYPQNC